MNRSVKENGGIYCHTVHIHCLGTKISKFWYMNQRVVDLVIARNEAVHICYLMLLPEI